MAQKLTERLHQIRTRLESATPGPWVHRPGGVVQSQSADRIIFWDDCPNVGDTHERIQPDYSLIAHAPADLRYLLSALEVATAALAWYADEKNYDNDGCPYYREPIPGRNGLNDVGDKATEALATIEGLGRVEGGE